MGQGWRTGYEGHGKAQGGENRGEDRGEVQEMRVREVRVRQGQGMRCKG